MYKFEINPRGHIWKKNDWNNEINIFGYERGEYCNGPVCIVCGYGFCHHCEDDTPQQDCVEQKEAQ
jgi:hypothetical protein